ncbi:glutamyl-tRNA synthetase /glutamate--tRNA(Gln) ligase [Caloramator quimbayensis]|uniref:Glutamate--tRNA ligase n=1 Tax=Caloramator quimbayensis TaxID=1147123 RepID=A0A1T4Y3Z8_9CLOT|nr:glutamate--tRNA ligase [Caloramator quimbayensis]SKA96031.1 glutamyl-tRNA synthetase /glutamate--tRNA(Gln) ligase [Caloramator quimbayensis]
MERVRFAPSPTGHLHIGGARTALFNYLYAKRTGGKFIVRIEDTDLNRSTTESEKVIIDSLKWFGINWDEGIEVGGPDEPYRSTERNFIYEPYVKKLIDEGKAYYCYCSEEEIEKERQESLSKGETYKYSGKCRNLTEEERKKLEEKGIKPVVRFRVPDNEPIIIDDAVRGRVEFNTNDIGDFIIVKSDGIPVYNFAVVVDDHLMKITTVIRGEEHLSNTPRQILIYKALGFDIPKFAHVSLILGKDRTKMSKRHGSTWVEQYEQAGYLPEALINFLALLGWSPEGDEEIFTLEELCEKFSLERVAKNPAVFDIDKLNHINGIYIRKSPIERIVDLSIPHLIKAGYITEEFAKDNRQYVTLLVSTFREKISHISEIVNHAAVLFGDEVKIENEEAAEVLKQEHVVSLLDELYAIVNEAEKLDNEFIQNMFKELKNRTGAKGKALFMPVRVALTGQVHGAELVNIIELLGKDNVLKRIEYTKKNLL